MLVKTHNNKFAALVIAVILVLGLTLPACAAAVPEPELSFEATKYKNAEHGFSVYHPAAWEGTEEPELGPTVVYAAGDPGEPPLPAMVIDVLEGDTLPIHSPRHWREVVPKTLRSSRRPRQL